MICQGFVKDYSGLMATRVFLGVFEGGLFPGVNFYITQWYVRNECGFRMALFFSAATLAGAFGGILARGIAEMVSQITLHDLELISLLNPTPERRRRKVRVGVDFHPRGYT
jgi:MFS family permease